MTRLVRGALFVLLVLVVPPHVAEACPVCFQNVESGLLDAARLGVLALAGVTIGVLVLFARWFLKLRRLAALHPPDQVESR